MKTKNFLLALVLVFISAPFISAQDNCNAELSVKKNWNIKTLENLSYTYSMILQNSGTESTEFILLADNSNELFENPDGMPNENNIVLSSEILDENLNPISSSVVLNAGGTIKFLVKLTASSDVSQNQWNCTEVTAEALNCEGEPLKVQLYSFNPNPAEQE